MGRNGETTLLANAHVLKALVPPLNHLTSEEAVRAHPTSTQLELEGRATIAARVELLAVLERPGVVHAQHVSILQT